MIPKMDISDIGALSSLSTVSSLYFLYCVVEFSDDPTAVVVEIHSEPGLTEHFLGRRPLDKCTQLAPVRGCSDCNSDSVQVSHTGQNLCLHLQQSPTRS